MDREGLSTLLRRVSALERRVHAMVRTGRVHGVQGDSYRVRADIGPDDDGAPVVTDWLPVLVPRSGEARIWTPCTVGERVCVLSPGGEDTAAFVLPALMSAAFGAPSADPAVELASYRALGDADTEVARVQVTRSGGGRLELAVGSSTIVMTPTEILLDADHVGIND